jgi:hypothetical protein
LLETAPEAGHTLERKYTGGWFQDAISVDQMGDVVWPCQVLPGLDDCRVDGCAGSGQLVFVGEASG